MDSAITIEDGLLDPYVVKYTKGMYDIYKKVKSNKRELKDGKYITLDEVYDRVVKASSASTLEGAIERVIQLRLEAGNKKVATLIDFYKNYRRIKEEVLKVFQVINKTQEERIHELEKAVSYLLEENKRKANITVG